MHAVMSCAYPETGPPTSVTANGAPLNYTVAKGAPGWHFEGNTLTTVITVPSTPMSQRVVVQVYRPTVMVRRRAELDGFAGSMVRLRDAYDTLNQTFPLAWSPDALIDVMQTGDRLTYHPQTVSQELTHFHIELPKAIEAVDEMKNAITPEDQKKMNKHLDNVWKHFTQTQLENYQNEVARAMAQLKEVGAHN